MTLPHRSDQTLFVILFALLFSTPSLGVQESEPNNTPETATALMGASIEHVGQLHAREDIDFFRATLPGPAILSISAKPEHSSPDGGVVRVAILDGQLRVLTERDLTSSSAGITVAATLGSGDYYIRVKRKDGYPLFDKNFLLSYATEATGPLKRLTVARTGSGRVVSAPAGINCGVCNADFNSGQVVTLSATPETGSVFSYWSGACSGLTSTCAVTMNADQGVTAHFAPAGRLTGLLAAVLPYARSVQVGQVATAFGTLVNATGVDVTHCSLALPDNPGLPATFNFQTTNASNQLVGPPNAPINIPAGGSQSFVFGITPTAAFAATDIPIVFDCANTLPAPSQTGLNTFLLSASGSPVADMVAIGATPSDDGVLRIPGNHGVHALATATINIGGSGEVTATADTGGAMLPLTLTLCQTDPAGGCLSPPAASVTGTVNTNQALTYAVFAQASGAIPFDPAVKRIFLRLASGGVVRGATSVAVTTE